MEIPTLPEWLKARTARAALVLGMLALGVACAHDNGNSNSTSDTPPVQASHDTLSSIEQEALIDCLRGELQQDPEPCSIRNALAKADG